MRRLRTRHMPTQSHDKKRPEMGEKDVVEEQLAMWTEYHTTRQEYDALVRAMGTPAEVDGDDRRIEELESILPDLERKAYGEPT